MTITQSMRAIPPHKRGAKIFNTVGGLIIAVGGFLLPKLGYPWQVGTAVAFIGGFVASKELMLAVAKILPASIAALVRALSGKNGDAAS